MIVHISPDSGYAKPRISRAGSGKQGSKYDDTLDALLGLEQGQAAVHETAEPFYSVEDAQKAATGLRQRGYVRSRNEPELRPFTIYTVEDPNSDGEYVVVITRPAKYFEDEE